MDHDGGHQALTRHMTFDSNNSGRWQSCKSVYSGKSTHSDCVKPTCSFAVCLSYLNRSRRNAEKSRSRCSCFDCCIPCMPESSRFASEDQEIDKSEMHQSIFHLHHFVHEVRLRGANQLLSSTCFPQKMSSTKRV
jgi:hypothetical protein